jgi:hypothetical protein
MSNPCIIAIKTIVRFLSSLQLTAASGRQALNDAIQEFAQNSSYKDDGPLLVFKEFILKLLGKSPDKSWSKVNPS